MTCDKTTYLSFSAADQALRKIRSRAKHNDRDTHGLPIRPYRCPKCTAWHLTSTPDRLGSRPHRKAA